MTLLKVFDTMKDISDKKFTNSADIQIEAGDVDENDVHKAMWLVAYTQLIILL